jgi:putative flavoprotein involved in K+ transport
LPRLFVRHVVDVAQTRARAGALLEQYAAFMQLEAGTSPESSGFRRARAEGGSVRCRRYRGGQTGLSVCYFLARKRIKFVLREARDGAGDTWLRRLGLATAVHSRLGILAGVRLPANPHYFPTRNGDYLEYYATRFSLPERTGVKLDGVTRTDGRYVVTDVVSEKGQVYSIKSKMIHLVGNQIHTL